jgi:sterol 3beta-glucosyltransferase
MTQNSEISAGIHSHLSRMHITIIALGSRGDVLPYVVLGEGLRAVGHQVRFVTFEGFRAMVTSRGLDLHPILGDAEALMSSASGISLAESGSNVVKGLIAILGSFGALTGEYLRVFSEKILWETDVILNQLPASLFGYDLAKKFGVPYWIVSVIPLLRTQTFPLPLFPQLPLGAWYNWLSYRLAEQMAWQPFRREVNRWRRTTLGLPDAPFWGHFREMIAQRIPVLNGFSEHVVPRAPEWGEHIHLTGYWYPAECDWEPPDELQRFLDGGPPPVFMGFGSMPVRNPQQLTRTVLDALVMSGQRAIISAGWAGIGSGELPDHVLKIDYVPYNWLFPRVAAIVHHGGSGTTAAGFRSGVPNVVLPFMMDQFFWGRRVFELGVGAEPIPHKRLTAGNLAAAIHQVMGDVAIQQRAAALGRLIRDEDGVSRAVELLTKSL